MNSPLQLIFLLFLGISSCGASGDGSKRSQGPGVIVDDGDASNIPKTDPLNPQGGNPVDAGLPLVYEPGLDSQKGEITISGTIKAPYKIKKGTIVLLKIFRKPIDPNVSIFDDPPFNGQSPETLSVETADITFEMRGYRAGFYKIGFAVDVDQDKIIEPAKGDLTGWFDGSLANPIDSDTNAKEIKIEIDTPDLVIGMKQLAPPPVDLYYSDSMSFVEMCKLNSPASAYGNTIKHIFNALSATTCEEAWTKYQANKNQTLSISFVGLSYKTDYLSDLRPFAGFKDLRVLTIRGTGPYAPVNASDFTPLTKLQYLQELRLGYASELSKSTSEAGEKGFWTNVAKLPALVKLSISYTDLGSMAEMLDGLVAQNKINNLTIYGCKISGLTEISRLTNLTSLDISGNQPTLTSYAGLNALTKLKSFYGNYNNSVSNALSTLTQLTGLQTLSLEGAQISAQASAFNPLSNLVSLNLRQNQITNPATFNLPKLEFLDMGYNGLTSFSYFPSSLKDLQLYYNSLTNANFLTQFPSLEKLNIVNNQLTTLPSLATLPALKDLRADTNLLTVFPTLGSKPQLTVISAKANQLTDISSIQSITDHATQDMTIDFSGNPLPDPQKICPSYAVKCSF